MAGAVRGLPVLDSSSGVVGKRRRSKGVVREVGVMSVASEVN
jgi:hypothetical protein